MKAISNPDVNLNDPVAVDTYDELPLWSAFAGQLLFRHLPITRSQTVLDVGCGTGFPAIEIAERLGRGSSVTGLDTWAEALRRAGQKAAFRELSNISFVNGDARAMPFPNGTFDLIVSNLGINDFDDPLSALRECRRVARHDARLVLTTNLKGHFAEFYSIFETIADEWTQSALLEHVDRRATSVRLRALLQQSNFVVTRIEEESVSMRFASGSAFLDHSFIRLGFFPAWRDLIAPEDRERTFQRLATALDAEASAHGGFKVTIPFAYIEGSAV